MKEYTLEDSQEPEFHNTITVTETTDTNHADNINRAPKQLFENTIYLKQQVDCSKSVILSGTLAAGATSITFENEALTEESRLDPYTDVYGVNPKNMAAEPGRVTLTFKPQDKDIQVKVVISNGIL